MSITHAGVSVAGFAVGASLIACGGGGGQGRAIVAEDLPQMVLQREDVEIGDLREASLGFESASASYEIQFQVPAAAAATGEIVCILNGVGLYDSVDAAAIAFEEITSFAGIASETPPGESDVAIDEVRAPDLGDRAAAYRITSPSALFCSNYENEPIDQHTILFRRHTLIAAVSVINLESGASLDDATDLAEVQESRINQALK